MISLRSRIIISFLSIIFLIITGSYLVIRDIQTGIIQKEFRDKGYLLANHLALEVTNPLLVNDLMEIRKSVNDLKESNPDIEYVFVTDSGGIVLVHTFEGGFPKALQNMSKPSNVMKESVYNTDRGIIHEFDAPLFKNIGYVHVGISENRVRAQLLDASQKLSLIAASAIVLGGIFAYLLGRRLTEPVLKLTEGANRINNGILDRKIEVRTGDELEELARTFNDMASSLDHKIKDLVASKEEIIVRNRELTVLNDISKNISETFDLDRTLVRTIENLLKLTGTESGGVYLHDEKSGEYSLRICAGLESNITLPACCKESLIVKGTQDFSGIKTETCGNDVCIPLKSKDKVLGIIILKSAEPHKFSNRDKYLFSSIGNQIGVAIENIIFYNNIKYLNEFNEEILNNVNLAIHVIDKDMKILAVNDELIHLSRGRFKKEQMLNKNLYEIYPFLLEKHVDKEYEYVLKSGEIFQSEDKTEYYGEIIYTSTSKIPIKDSNGNVGKIITVIKDVSDQKRLEEELRDSYEELRLTYSRLKELYKIKDNFLSNISHELRTPLTSIMGYTELILEENITGDQRHKLEVIHRNSKRLSNLINMLLDTTLIESRNLQLERQMLSIHDLAVQVAEDIKNTASIKNIPVHIEIPESLTIEGDRDRLFQVFSNILDNAIKFTIKGGKIDG